MRQANEFVWVYMGYVCRVSPAPIGTWGEWMWSASDVRGDGYGGFSKTANDAKSDAENWVIEKKADWQ